MRPKKLATTGRSAETVGGSDTSGTTSIATTILDAVYIDMKDRKAIVSVKAKPTFQAVFGVAGSAGDESVEVQRLSAWFR